MVLKQQQNGFGLIELLIGLMLSSLMVVTLAQFYLGQKQHYSQLEKKLSARLDAWLIADLLSDSIRKAGFTPCMNVKDLTVYDAREHPHDISPLTMNPLSLGHVKVSRMSDDFSSLTIIDETHLFISKKLFLKPNQDVMIANCVQAEIHSITQIKPMAHGYILTLKRPLFFTYPMNPYIGEWIEEAWTVKSHSLSEHSLYYTHKTTEELSTFVNAFSVATHWVNNKEIVTILFHLADKTEINLLIAIRSS